MNTHPWVMCLLAGITVLFSLAGQAEPILSLDEATTMAIQEQPLLQSLDYASESSREAAVASGQLPDPELTLGIANLPITTSDAFRLNRDDMTMTTIGIEQDMVPRAQREAEANILHATAAQYQAEKSAIAQTIKRDVALAWLNVFEAQRKVELYKELLNEVEAERKVLLSRISTGTTELNAVIELDTQLSMTKDKELVASREERIARAALARWIGPASDRRLPQELPALLIPIGLEPSQSIDNHPSIENARQTEAVAKNSAERARAERELDWSWGVMYGKRYAGMSDMMSVQISVELPWDRPNRQDRLLAEKQLLVERANKLTEDKRQELRAEFRSALAEVEVAKARELEHQERLIPASKARLQLAEAGYAAGKGNLTEVWNARQELIQVQLEHWSILTDEQRAAVKLDYLLTNAGAKQDIQ